jgi:hypothetical protein
MAAEDSALADEINTASSDSAPKMPDPLDTDTKLLRGLHVKETDEWHDVAHVRELNGEDEEFLATLGAKNSVSYSEYLTGVLERGVESIGTLPATFDTIEKLILPDRDMLFLAVIKATYGDEREIVTVCPSCGARNNIILELENDFPVKRPEGRDFREPLKVSLKDGMAHFNYPTGEVASYASKHSKNTAHLDTLVIAQCVITQDDTPLEERIEWARALAVPDRKKVDAALTEAVQGVGPQLGEVNTRCSSCATEVPLSMDWVSLLLG